MLAQDLDDLDAMITRFTALDPHAVTGTDAAAAVVRLGEATDRLLAARLTLLPAVTESGVWGLDGSRTASVWLARVERSSKAAAGGALKTARGLADLPATHAAVLEGSVPLGHAEAMTRTCLRTPRLREALTDPVCGEDFLLAHAHLGLDAYRVLLNTWAVRADPEAADAAYRDDQARHQLLLADTTDGTDVTGKLSPLGGETVRAALLAQIGIPAKDDPRTHGQRLHDALIALAAAALDGGTLGRHASVRPQIVVHVDYPTYRGLLTPNDEGAAGLPPGGAVRRYCRSPGSRWPRSSSAGSTATAKSPGSCSAPRARFSTSAGLNAPSPAPCAVPWTPATAAAAPRTARTHHA